MPVRQTVGNPRFAPNCVNSKRTAYSIAHSHCLKSTKLGFLFKPVQLEIVYQDSTSMKILSATESILHRAVADVKGCSDLLLRCVP